MPGYRRAKGLVLAEVSAEDRIEGENASGQYRGLRPGFVGDAAHPFTPGIVGRPSRAETRRGGAKIGHPGGDRGGKMIVRAAARHAIADRIEEPLHDLLRAVGRDLVIAMGYRLVVQTRESLRDIGLDINARPGRQARRGFGFQHSTDKIEKDGIAHILISIVESAEQTEISQGRLGRVEHSHFYKFMSGYVANEFRAAGLPSR